MRKQLLAGAMALAFATMMTSGAMAASQNDKSQNDKSHSVRGKHAAIHGGPGRRTVRGYSEPLNGDRGPGFSLGISGVGIGVDNDYGCSPTDKAYIGGFCGDYVPN